LSCLQQLIILAVSWSPSGVLNPTQFAVDLLSARASFQNYYNRLWGAGEGPPPARGAPARREQGTPQKNRNFPPKKSNKDIS
jgi:hypothetical protein